jgi:hypothetical protein
MNNERLPTKMCHSDRSQRRACLYYHEKTGRCTLDRDAVWDARAEFDAGEQQQKRQTPPGDDDRVPAE